MPAQRNYRSAALDPYLLAALLGTQAKAQTTPLPLRWAAGSVPTRQQVPVAPQEGGETVVNPADLIEAGIVDAGGQVLPNSYYVEPSLWNAMTPELQAEVLLYGWPLKRQDQQETMTEEDAALARAQEEAKLRALQIQNEASDTPRTAAKTIDPNLVGQALLNASWLRQGISPEDVYGYDPQAAAQQQAFENSLAQSQTNATWANIARAMAEAQLSADRDAYQLDAQWGLPNVGDLYALQQPGGFIANALAGSGMSYSPTPAREIPVPNLWTNWARAQQALGGGQ